jgi:hypothetical protein
MYRDSWRFYIIQFIAVDIRCVRCRIFVFAYRGTRYVKKHLPITSFAPLSHVPLVHWLYFVGFAMVLVGLALYHSSKQPVSVTLCMSEATESTSQPSEVASTVDYNPLSGSINFYGNLNDEDFNGRFLLCIHLNSYYALTYLQYQPI